MTASPICDSVYEFDRDLVPPPSEILVRFADRTVANRNTTYVGDERRSEPRHAVAIDVLAIPLDKKFKKCGDPFIAITRDLSSSGIAMFHNQHVTAKYLALEIIDAEGVRLRLVLSVLRSSPVGLFYEIGGRFIKKFESTSIDVETSTPADAETAST
jgi:hypothetical protein